MNNRIKIKKELYKTCEDRIGARISAIEKTLESITESRNNETKSSAGDKYETGRAMMQMEEEKGKSQLMHANRVLNDLSKIDLNKISTKVEFGSLVKTNNGDYFISIGEGKIHVNMELYYCISIKSPIGMRMMGKEVGEEIEFNGKKILVLDIS